MAAIMLGNTLAVEKHHNYDLDTAHSWQYGGNSEIGKISVILLYFKPSAILSLTRIRNLYCSKYLTQMLIDSHKIFF